MHDVAAAEFMAFVEHRADLGSGKIAVHEGISSGGLDDVNPRGNTAIGGDVKMLRPHPVDDILGVPPTLAQRGGKTDLVCDLDTGALAVTAQRPGNEIHR